MVEKYSLKEMLKEIENDEKIRMNQNVRITQEEISQVVLKRKDKRHSDAHEKKS